MNYFQLFLLIIDGSQKQIKCSDYEAEKFNAAEKWENKVTERKIFAFIFLNIGLFLLEKRSF
jgi:hypothetical protein